MFESVVFIILCLIWGSTWLAIKIGLEGAPPFISAGLRFTVAALALYLFAAISGRWNFSFLKRWPTVLIAGLALYPIPYGLVYWGTQYIESGLAAVLFAVMPFFVGILAHFYLPGERLTMIKVIGMILGFSGILVIFAGSLGTRGSLGIFGMAAVVASSFFSSLGAVLMKKHFHDTNPVPITAVHTTIGAAILGSVGLCIEPLSNIKYDLATIGSIAYLGLFGTALTFSLYFLLLRKTEATKLSIIAFITPVVALILGIIYRGERFEIGGIIGSLMVIGGVYIVVMGNSLRRLRTQEANL